MKGEIAPGCCPGQGSLKPGIGNTLFRQHSGVQAKTSAGVRHEGLWPSGGRRNAGCEGLCAGSAAWGRGPSGTSGEEERPSGSERGLWRWGGASVSGRGLRGGVGPLSKAWTRRGGVSGQGRNLQRGEGPLGRARTWRGGALVPGRGLPGSGGDGPVDPGVPLRAVLLRLGAFSSLALWKVLVPGSAPRETLASETRPGRTRTGLYL